MRNGRRNNWVKSHRVEYSSAVDGVSEFVGVSFIDHHTLPVLNAKGLGGIGADPPEYHSPPAARPVQPGPARPPALPTALCIGRGTIPRDPVEPATVAANRMPSGWRC